MARYRILIADPLLGMGLQWPPGCSLVRQLEPGPAGQHWHEFDDPDAPEGMEGREVELTLARGEPGEDGKPGEPWIVARHVIVTHLCPPGDDSGVMPCCGQTPFEVPRSDRITADKDLVTCGSES
jgi:hypothetical protein